MQWPRLLSGSAADEIAKRLRAADAEVIAAPESFFVRTEPRLGYELVPGELARVASWANDVADHVREAAIA
jgi:hypothetical protein